MVCIHCGGKTQVVNSRTQKRANQVWRRRQCAGCGATFTTEERAQHGGAWRVRGKTGGLEPFSRDKLLLSLHRSCKHRPAALADAGGLTATIITKLAEHAKDGVIDRADITQTVQVALNRFDRAASVHYQVFHQR